MTKKDVLLSIYSGLVRAVENDDKRLVSQHLKFLNTLSFYETDNRGVRCPKVAKAVNGLMAVSWTNKYFLTEC